MPTRGPGTSVAVGPGVVRILALTTIAPLLGCSGLVEPTPAGPAGAPRPPGVVPPGGDADAPVVPHAPAMMRLTAEQYRRSLTDVFGPEVLPVDAALPPDRNGEHFLSIGAANVSTSEREVELYAAAAIEVATRLWDARARFPETAGCAPTSADDPCVRAVVAAVGRRLFRRPLSEDEIERHAGTAALAETMPEADELGRSTALEVGMRYALAGLLASPAFLYVSQRGEMDPELGVHRYTSLEMASRLAYFVWGSTPDEELLSLGETGELLDPEVIAVQVRRMLDDDRGRELVVRFFEESWRVHDLTELDKSPARFPEWSPSLASAAQQELRLSLRGLDRPGQSVLGIFGRRTTWVNAELGALYGVEVEGDEMREVDLPEARAGLLTSVAVLAANAKPNRTSPTQRGIFLRWNALCLPVPPPAPGVMTELAEDGADPDDPRSVREQLERHRSDPVCAGCHTLFDPMGMTLESFDAIGRFRTEDRGFPVDTASTFEGNELSSARDLAAFLENDPRTARCIAQQLYTFASGHAPTRDERGAVDVVDRELVASGHEFRALVVAIATNVGFRYFTPEEGDR